MNNLAFVEFSVPPRWLPSQEAPISGERAVKRHGKQLGKRSAACQQEGPKDGKSVALGPYNLTHQQRSELALRTAFGHGQKYQPSSSFAASQPYYGKGRRSESYTEKWQDWRSWSSFNLSSATAEPSTGSLTRSQSAARRASWETAKSQGSTSD